MSEIENGLSKNKANYASLSPLSFLERTRKTFPNQIAIEYKDYKLTYQQAGERCEALAEFIRNKKFADGSTIAVMHLTFQLCGSVILVYRWQLVF